MEMEKTFKEGNHNQQSHAKPGPNKGKKTNTLDWQEANQEEHRKGQSPEPNLKKKNRQHLKINPQRTRETPNNQKLHLKTKHLN